MSLAPLAGCCEQPDVPVGEILVVNDSDADVVATIDVEGARTLTLHAGEIFILAGPAGTQPLVFKSGDSTFKRPVDIAQNQVTVVTTSEGTCPVVVDYTKQYDFKEGQIDILAMGTETAPARIDPQVVAFMKGPQDRLPEGIPKGGTMRRVVSIPCQAAVASPELSKHLAGLE